MAKKLTNLNPGEVSLVPRGANRRKFLIMKSEEFSSNVLDALDSFEGEEFEGAEEVLAKMDEADANIFRGAVRLFKSVKDKIPQDVIEKAGFGETVIVEKRTKLGDFMRKTAKEKGISDEALAKAGGIDASTVGQIMRGEIERPPDKRLAGFAKALGVPASMLTSMVEKEDPGPGKPDPKPKEGDKMEVFKEDGSLNTEAIPEESRPFAEAIFKQFSTIKTHNEKITKENEDLKGEVQSLKDDKQTKEFVQKAAADFEQLGDPKELGPVLKSIRNNCSDEEWGKVETLLKASNERVAKSDVIFKEFGGPGAQQTGDTATDEFMGKIEKIQKEDKDLTYDQAFEKAAGEDPGLYDRYQAETTQRV